MGRAWPTESSGGSGGGGLSGVWNPYAPPTVPNINDEEFFDKANVGETGLTEQDTGNIAAWDISEGALTCDHTFDTANRAAAQWVPATADDEQEWYTAVTFPALYNTRSNTNYAGLGLSDGIGGVAVINRGATLSEGAGGRGRIDFAVDPNWTSGAGGAGHYTTSEYRFAGQVHFMCVQFKKSAVGSAIRQWWWLSANGLDWQLAVTRTAAQTIDPAFVSLYARNAGDSMTMRWHFLRLSRAGASGIVGTKPQPSGGALV